MDNIFFIFSKVLWTVASPGNFLCLLLVISTYFAWRGNLVIVKKSLLLLVVLFCVIALIPLGNYLIRPLEQAYPIHPKIPETLTGIIVLGGAINPLASIKSKQVQFGSAVERELTFLTLARQYPSAKLVYAGGSGNLLQTQYKESTAALQFFQQQGFNTKRILFEPRSRNTYENILYSQQLVKPEKNEQWLLITSASHMPRAVGVFNQLQWPVIPYPVDYQVVQEPSFNFSVNFSGHLNGLEQGIKEWLGLLAYWLSGKI